MKILLAYDGSETAEAALLDVPSAGLPEEASVEVLTIDEPTDPLIDFDVTTLTRHHQRSVDPRRIASIAVERLSLTMPAAAVSVRTAVGSAADTIVGIAEMDAADLVVLGSGSNGPLARLNLGSVSSRVVHRCNRSVRIGRHRPHAPGTTETRIVVGVDGSVASRAALRAVRERDFAGGCEIWLATALDGGMGEPEEREARLRAEAIQRAETGHLEGRHRSVHSVVIIGDAVGTLLSLADDVDADAIFVGATGERGLLAALLGSTAATVAERAACSVEIVRPPRIDGTS